MYATLLLRINDLQLQSLISNMSNKSVIRLLDALETEKQMYNDLLIKSFDAPTRREQVMLKQQYNKLMQKEEHTTEEKELIKSLESSTKFVGQLRGGYLITDEEILNNIIYVESSISSLITDILKYKQFTTDSIYNLSYDFIAVNRSAFISKFFESLILNREDTLAKLKDALKLNNVEEMQLISQQTLNGLKDYVEGNFERNSIKLQELVTTDKDFVDTVNSLLSVALSISEQLRGYESIEEIHKILPTVNSVWVDLCINFIFEYLTEKPSDLFHILPKDAAQVLYRKVVRV